MVRISTAEKQIMDVLWQESPLDARSIIKRIAPQNDWHEKTVRTLLSRLVKKEAIAYQTEERRYLYYPNLQEDEYTQIESKNFLEQVFHGKVTPLIASFAEQNILSKKEIKELKKLLEELEK